MSAGDIEFDFEQDVLRMLPKIEDDTIQQEMGGFNKVSDHKRRKIVCKHWLLGLCHNGMRCDYLHRLDRNKMPPCKHGKLCKIKNCPLKHVAEEELEECAYYKQGFCYSGPNCNRRHEKRTPEECPVEAIFDQGPQPQAGAKKQKVTQQRSENFKVTLCNHWLTKGSCPFNDGCIFAHGEEEINQGNQTMAEFLVDEDIYDPTRGLMGIPLELPFPENSRCQFYILQSPDLRSLSIAKRRGVWAVPSRMAAEMNAARKASGNVVLFFCVRPLRAIYGVAKLMGNIVQASAPLTAEFPIQWLRSCRVSLSTVAQLKLGNSGMFVGRSSTDGRFDNRVGLELLLTIYRKPPWEWTLDVDSAERNIRLTEKPGAPVGEYYPSDGKVPYSLHDDVLFSQDWVERAMLPTDEKGVLIIGGRSLDAPPPPPELYTGSGPGFIACGTKPQVEEMLGRMLLGLPAVFQDMKIPVGAPLFIFDMQSSIMLGVFFATTQLQSLLVPDAFWDGSACSLPLQLGFRPAFDSYPAQVSVQDPELYQVLGESLRNMGLIGAAEARQLCNLFQRRFLATQQMFRQPFANHGRRQNFRKKM